MGCSQMRINSDNAISEIVAISLVLMIVTGALSAILFWGVPYMQEKKSYIAIESALLQLDVLGEMIDDAFNNGINTSKTMNFKVDSGKIKFNPAGERFIIYFPTYNFGNIQAAYRNELFDFEINKFDDEYNNNFELTVSNAKNFGTGRINLKFIITDLLNLTSETVNSGLFSIGGTTSITTNNILLNGAIKIDIKRQDPFEVDYGRIYLFDTGSLVYEKGTEIGTHRIFIENDCIMSARDTIGNLFYHEPRTWSQTLLTDNTIVTLRFIKFILNEEYNIDEIGGNSAIDIKLILTADESNIQEKKIPIFGNLKMKIYGGYDHG